METEEERSHRTIEKGFYEQLQIEVEAWREEDLITLEQGSAILSTYDTAEESVKSRQMYGRVIGIVATMGVVLVGTGVILFVASNWQLIPRFGKLALIISVLMATYGSGYWLKYERELPRVGSAIILMGTFFFGAAIFLIGQTYHMRLDDPNLLTWWFLGTIPIAYLTRSRAILTLAIINALGGLGYRASFWLSDSRDATTLLGFISLYTVLGVLVYTFGTAHTGFRQSAFFKTPFLNIGLVTAFFSLYLLSFKFVFDFYSRPFRAIDDIGLFMLPFNIIVATAVLALAGSAALAYRKKMSFSTLRYELVGGAILVAIAYGVLLIRLNDAAIYVILFNLILFGLCVAVIFLGYLKREGSLINIGLAFFSIALVTRYFDFGWGLFDRSLYFIGGGLILLVAGILMERVRRQLLRRMMRGEA